MRPFWKLILAEIKNSRKQAKNVSTRHYSCCVQRTARKNSEYSKNETILKIGPLGQTIKMQKKYAKSVSTRHCSCSMKKTAQKNS